MSKRRLSQTELRIWRKVAKTVDPIRKTVEPKTPAQEDFPSLLNEQDESEKPIIPLVHKGRWHRKDHHAKDDEHVTPKSPAADRGGEKKVRRGRLEIDGSLDLHGHTQDTAHQALQTFVAFHRSQGARCVLVITGKGKAGEGVIRKRFLDWLNSPEIRAHVSSYAQSHQRHGGAGAYYVFLKRQDRRH